MSEIDVGGFLVLNAASIDQVVERFADAPNIQLGGSALARPGQPTPADH